MTRSELLKPIRERLQELYGPRFRGLALFGGVARGYDEPDSDIDLLCLLEGPVNPCKEVRPIVETTSSIRRMYADRPISIYAVGADEYERGAYPLVIEAKKDGVPV